MGLLISGITLSDRDGQGERPPSRRYERQSDAVATVCRGAQTWVIWRISGSRWRRLAHRRLSAAGQAGKACWSRTAISFSTSGTGRGSSIPKRRAPDEVG